MAGPYERRYAPKGSTLEARLRLHMIEAPSGCWIWIGTRHERGYGRLQINGASAYAHRVSYEIFAPSVNVRRGTSPGAQASRRDKCPAGHSFAEHGAIRHGRRICRPCRREYCAQWRAEVAAGVRVPARRNKAA